MERNKWNAVLFITIILVQLGFTLPIVKRDTVNVLAAEPEIETSKQTVLTSEDVFGPVLPYRSDRDKKGIKEAIVTGVFSLGQGLIGIVFGTVNSIIDKKTELVKQLDKQNVQKNYELLGLGHPWTDAPSAAKPSSTGYP